MADVKIITNMSYPGPGTELTFKKKKNHYFFPETEPTYQSTVLNSLFILYIVNIHQNFNLVNEKYVNSYTDMHYTFQAVL